MMRRDLKTDLSLCLLLLGLAACGSSAVAQIPGTFTASGNMTAARAGHTATLLLNGKVLIAGGLVANAYPPVLLASAEVYDPATGTLTATGNMTTVRAWHTATLLHDGRVLIAGGDFSLEGSPQTSTAELYDPSTGAFTATANMLIGQTNYTATLLGNGKVLIAGGIAGECCDAKIARAELYDPSTGTFTFTGLYAGPGTPGYILGGPGYPTAALLSDGRVLLAGEPTAELYDPVSETFSLTGEMVTRVFGNKPAYIAGRTGTLLPNGKVLLTGGGQPQGNSADIPIADAELYDASTGMFTATGSMTKARYGHTATLLPDGKVLIAGGEGDACNGTTCIVSGSEASAEIYDPGTGTFAATGSMTSLREWHTSTLLYDGRVLITGGFDWPGLAFLSPSAATTEIYTNFFPVPLAYSGLAISASGGSGSISLTLPAGSAWAASTTVDWITFIGPAAGAGSGTLTYQVAPNTGAGRSAAITVTGFSFTVEQQAATVPGLGLIGALPHIAAEENWTTAFTLVNKSTAPAVARVSLFDDPGGALTLPLGFPQLLPAALPLLAASFDRTLGANASLTMDTSGPQVPPVVQGSAQLAATEPVDGFAIFHNVVTSQEAVVPLETRNARAYWLPFDNTGGVVMGIAVENLSAQAANIPVQIRDDSGVPISAGLSVSVAGNGHYSFVLSDPVQGFALTANRRGTIEFDTPLDGRISVLGLCFTPPNNALTTIPALADVGTTGGSIAHVASGGDGWETTFVLVNVGNTAAQATVSFFADQSGSPLSLPLSFPQIGSGASRVDSSVTQTLAAGATLLVTSSGAPQLLTGSAQLSTNGNVSGFVIFHHGNQQAVVPLESRKASGYILAFDNTNSTSTGVAVNAISTQAVNIPVTVRDDTGVQIATDTITLAANGHYAFTLAADRYPVTANLRGTIEFGAPAGVEIGALGIRIPVAHTFTTLPVLAK